MPPSPICCEQLVRADDRAGPLPAIGWSSRWRSSASGGGFEEAAGLRRELAEALDAAAQAGRLPHRPRPGRRPGPGGRSFSRAAKKTTRSSVAVHCCFARLGPASRAGLAESPDSRPALYRNSAPNGPETAPLILEESERSSHSPSADSCCQLGVEPGAGVAPVAVRGGGGNAQSTAAASGMVMPAK